MCKQISEELRTYILSGLRDESTTVGGRCGTAGSSGRMKFSVDKKHATVIVFTHTYTHRRRRAFIYYRFCVGEKDGERGRRRKDAERVRGGHRPDLIPSDLLNWFHEMCAHIVVVQSRRSKGRKKTNKVEIEQTHTRAHQYIYAHGRNNTHARTHESYPRAVNYNGKSKVPKLPPFAYFFFFFLRAIIYYIHFCAHI